MENQELTKESSIYTAETKKNLLQQLEAAKKKKKRFHFGLGSRKKQAYADSFVPARGSVYLMLDREVDTKGKYVK